MDDSIMHPLTAQALGLVRYDEFRLADESTYTRLCEDAYKYFIANPALVRYYCWVPELGAIYVQRSALGGKYAVA